MLPPQLPNATSTGSPHHTLTSLVRCGPVQPRSVRFSTSLHGFDRAHATTPQGPHAQPGTAAGHRCPSPPARSSRAPCPKPSRAPGSTGPPACPREISSGSARLSRPAARRRGSRLGPPATGPRLDQRPPVSTSDTSDEPPQIPRPPLREVLRRPLKTAPRSERRLAQISRRTRIAQQSTDTGTAHR